MTSTAARLLPAGLRLSGRRRPYADPALMRRRVAAAQLRPAAYGPPRRLGRDVRVDVRRQEGWPVYVVRPAGEVRGQVVYVHGGGWVGEVHPLHWRLVAQLAADGRVAVTVPVYPLAPVGTAATVVPVVARLARELATQPGGVALAGDSAGGQIALSAALLLRDDGVRVRRTALVAPALDLRLVNPDIDRVEPHDPWLARPGLRVAIDLWRGDLPLEDPRVSPLLGELGGLGPLTVVNGTRDITWPDAALLVERARTAGVEVELLVGDGLVHVYPLLPLPEARQARELLVRALALPV